MTKKESAMSNYTVHYPFRIRVAFLMESPFFQHLLLFIIMLNAGGLFYLALTFSREEAVAHPIYGLAGVAVALFFVELLMRIYASCGRFFRNIWNIFDAMIILLALYPPFTLISILRVLRLMRATNILNAFPGASMLTELLRNNVRTIVSFLLISLVLVVTQALISMHFLYDYMPAHFSSFGEALIFSFCLMFLEWPADAVHQATQFYDFLFYLFSGFWLSTKLLMTLFVWLLAINALELVKQRG